MRSPANSLRNVLWSILLVLALGGMIARLSDVRYLPAEQPPVLQVTIAFPGKLTSSWDMRIPVPRGREDEARTLAASFGAGRWGVLAAAASPA